VAVARQTGKRMSFVRTTPSLLRLFSVLLTLWLTLCGITGWASMNTRADATTRLRTNTAPALVSIQRIRSSLAEADSAASANFLSGSFSDRQQQRVFDIAIRRVSASLEEASRRIGNDETSHDLIASLNAKLVIYGGLVEAAKTELLITTQAKAGNRLTTASNFITARIDPELRELTDRATSQYNLDEGRATFFPLGISLAFVVGLIGLIAVQFFLSVRTRRTLNAPLLLATLLLFSSWIVAIVAGNGHKSNLELARTKALVGINQLAEVRTAAYQLQAGNNAQLISGSGIRGLAVSENALASSRVVNGSMEPGLLSKAGESQRDVVGYQLSEEMFVRWERYAQSLEALRAQDPKEQAALATTLSEPFTGFNVTLDSLLANDERRFFDRYQQGQRRLRGIPAMLFVVPLVAALLVAFGLQRRINEYR
jgi:hypothetical protein